jgi:plastocyanin
MALVAPTQLLAKQERPAAVAAGISAPAARAGIDAAPAAATRTAPTSGPHAQKAAAAAVTIKDFDFGPAAITIHAGDTITWTNDGPTAHSATADNGSFDTGVFSAGGSVSETFTSPGTIAYHCTPHPFMTATITVLPSNSGPHARKTGSSGSGGSGSSGSGSSGSSSAAPAATATPAASSPGSPGSSRSSGSGSLASTGFDPLPLTVLGLLLLAAGVAIKGRRRPGA